MGELTKKERHLPPALSHALGGTKRQQLEKLRGAAGASQQTLKTAEREELSKKRVQEALEDGEDI